MPWTVAALVGVGIGAGLTACVWMGATAVWIRSIGQSLIAIEAILRHRR